MLSVLIFVVVLTLAVSSMCSLLEATLYSTRVATLEAARDQGRHRGLARQLLRLKRDIAVPTSAILILNTVANTTGATLAGMLASDLFGSKFIGFFSGALTLAILLLAEILPKTFGATYWKTLWPLVVWPLLILEQVLRPLIWVTQAFAGLFVRGRPGPATTQDEIVAMIRMGADAGELSDTEHRLLRSVFRFDELRARDVMLPRRDVVVFDAEWSLDRCLEEAKRSKHTRYPLIRGSLDAAVGVVHVKDLLGVDAGDHTELGSLARPMRQVPETMLIRVVLHQMQRSQPHMAAVVDEHGTTVGVITLEQVLEQLVGAVRDEFDPPDPEVVPAGPGAYLLKGATPLAVVEELLERRLSDHGVSTLSGLVMAVRGQLPAAGDTIDVEGATIEVVEVGQLRAERLKVTLRPDAEPGEGLELDAEADQPAVSPPNGAGSIPTERSER